MSRNEPRISVATIEGAQEQIERASRYLAGIPQGVEIAMLNAMRRALTAGRTAGTRKVREVYAIRAGDVRKAFVMSRRPSRSDLEGELKSRGKSLPLNRFRFRPTSDTTGARRRLVRVSVKKEGGLKPLGQAFVHEGNVFQRIGKTSYPIRPVYAISIPQMLGEERVVDAVQDTMLETTNKRLDHEIYRLLNGFEGHAKWRD